ncbi:hypothetical protein VTN02DRAFT_1694 [Thermoascus thermophilus]
MQETNSLRRSLFFSFFATLHSIEPPVRTFIKVKRSSSSFLTGFWIPKKTCWSILSSRCLVPHRKRTLYQSAGLVWFPYRVPYYHLDSDWVDVSRASFSTIDLSDATVPSVRTTTRGIVKQCGEKKHSTVD